MKFINYYQYNYWECTINGHNKFWMVGIAEENGKFFVVRRWGALKTKGQSMVLGYLNEFLAKEALLKLVKDKENNGYIAKF
jgi:predicted DNA-binding WGR domain protein